MWVLVINGLLYLIHGLASRHFQRDLLPVTACSVGRDLRAALRFELKHEHGVYNALQRLMYWLVLAAGVLIAASGLAIWKPVQLQMLVALLGGYDTARYVHFTAMAAIGAFVVVHVAMVLLVPKTCLPMITGGKREDTRGENRT